jgi:hypothetical protein
MKKDFIPYEQALALKELGFDEPCFGGYYSNQDNVNLWFFKEAKNSDRDERVREGFATAPTYSQAFRWFREEYVFYVNMVGPDLFYFVVHLVNPIKEPTDLFISEHCKTHEKAELACLKKLIELSTQTK